MDEFQSRLVKLKKQLWELLGSKFENQISDRPGSQLLRQLESQLLHQLWLRLHDQLKITTQAAEEA